MIPVEEAIRAKHLTCGFMAQWRDVLKEDRLMYPSGVDDVTEMSLALASAPLYTWARPIKRIVDESCESYPLDDAVEALHHFHQPVMFWLFDDPVLWVTPPAGEQWSGETADAPAPVDAILVAPMAIGAARSPQQLFEFAMRLSSGTPEERAALREEIMSRATGVLIVAFSSIRTGVRVALPFGQEAPIGSRLCTPIMQALFTFGHPAGELDIIDTQVNDPTLRQEQTRLKQWVLAGSALLKQRILVAERQTATRPERKRLAADNLATSVMTIALRATEHKSAGQTNPVEWSHRWIVRGHWRQQWYPADDAHRVIWIPPYIKGPDACPLIVRDAVYAVNR